jgi:hypothetical protein
MPLALSTRARSAVASTEATLPPINETDLDRVLKLIPTEILAFYTAAVPLSAEVRWRGFPFVLFVVGLALVPFVLYVDGRNTNQDAKWPQYAIRCLAFVAWANAISTPFSLWSGNYNLSWLRSLAVLVVPLVGGLVLREQPPSALPT